MSDYYEILGINKNASIQEIKQAFRNLAQKYHPDKKGGNAEKFREINEAYQTLSDAEKRKMYDQYGPAFNQAQAKGGFSGFDNFRDWASWAEAMKENGNKFDFGDFGFGNLGDLFENIFSRDEDSSFRGFRKKTKSPFQKQGKDIEIELAIDFREAVFGTEKEIKLEKYVKCDDCAGLGTEPGTKFNICPQCGGRGQILTSQNTFFGTFQTSSICPECRGQGKIPEKKCKKCQGKGRIKNLSKIKIKIPAGIGQGQTIKFFQQGEAGESGAISGDLYVTVLIRTDPEFIRQGNDIFSQKEISISQAILGDKIEIKTIDGFLKLKIPPGTSSGQSFKLKNKGIIYLSSFKNKIKERGDHIVKIKIKIPKNLTKKQKKLLEELKQEGL
ncbi:MAG: molecular chaperone DnaJ [Patescibacteria group bacterium]|nr:molecular chaperone DnaJ [Patescibacteria group bacterium]MDD5172538.1 molecular chaperone DnaJ [Patescibacteria group bacterium]